MLNYDNDDTNHNSLQKARRTCSCLLRFLLFECFCDFFFGNVGLITSFKDVFIDTVHNSTLLNNHSRHLFVDFGQISHLLQDILYSFISILKVKLHLSLLLYLLQMSGVDISLLFLFFRFTV